MCVFNVKYPSLKKKERKSDRDDSSIRDCTFISRSFIFLGEIQATHISPNFAAVLLTGRERGARLHPSLGESTAIALMRGKVLIIRSR